MPEGFKLNKYHNWPYCLAGLCEIGFEGFDVLPKISAVEQEHCLRVAPGKTILVSGIELGRAEFSIWIVGSGKFEAFAIPAIRNKVFCEKKGIHVYQLR